MNLQQFSLAGKTALITGMSRGIGLAVAQAMAACGARIIGVGSSLLPEDFGANNGLNQDGNVFRSYQADLGDRASIYALLERLKADDCQVDILVNNAGGILRQPAAEHSDEYWDNIINLNLNAPFLLTREMGKQMIARGQGKIIFTCSLLSFQGGVNVPGYAASKGALASLLKAFANEWASKGVNVNGVAPGYISTDNTEALRNDPDRSASILGRIPAGRWGQPEDLAGAYVFLASAASNYINGHILAVDGGWLGR